MDMLKKIIQKFRKENEEETKEQSTEGFKCVHCGKIYPDEISLRDHVKRMHE